MDYTDILNDIYSVLSSISSVLSDIFLGLSDLDMSNILESIFLLLAMFMILSVIKGD